MGPILIKEILVLIKNHKLINKNLKIVNLEILKVKTWFGDKDLFSEICLIKPNDFTKVINSLSKTDDFTKVINSFSKTDDFIKTHKFS